MHLHFATYSADFRIGTLIAVMGLSPLISLPMNHPNPHLAISGASMDVVVRKNYKRHVVVAAGALFIVPVIVAGILHWMPRGLQVKSTGLRIASVERGQFLDDIAVRANVAPQNSIILDSVESGRVEEVFASDGAVVNKGSPLFRLSNPQRELDLLARQSDQATQISNLSNLRANLEASITDHERRIADLEFNVAQADKLYERNQQLAAHGFISSAALSDYADKLAQHRYELDEEIKRGDAEIAIKRRGLVEMEQASARLESGLALMNKSIDALTVRAPMTGRLTDFHLQVGEAVATSQHIGRIDDPSRFKLIADIDEYYLNHVSIGRKAIMQIGSDTYALKVDKVYPQIDKGRFRVDLLFAQEQPKQLNPGQSTDIQIVLGDPIPALLLPNGAFINDSGGVFAFVLNADGELAERRAIRLGRRNDSQVEVIAGLAAGDKVIVSGYAGFGHANRLQLTKD